DLVSLAIDFCQCTVLPAGDQSRLAGDRIVFVHPLSYSPRRLKSKIGIATVLLTPVEQAAGSQNGTGFAFYLAIMNDRLQSHLDFIQFALAEIIQAEAVIGD